MLDAIIDVSRAVFIMSLITTILSGLVYHLSSGL